MQLGIYKHYKGNLYEVIGEAYYSGTLEPHIIYRALYESKDFPQGTMWVRPKSMFAEYVMYNDKEVKRFEYIGKNTKNLL